MRSQMNNLRLGDKVTVRMPDGAIRNGTINRINFKVQKCEVQWENPIMVSVIDLENLLPPF